MAARLEAEYRNLSERFCLKSSDYQKQFSHLYAYRLEEFTQLLKPLIKGKFDDRYSIKQLCDLSEEQQALCVIIGTIYKHQVYKPSILRDISEENQLAPQPPRDHYADPDDKIILEDNLQRVCLQGTVNGREIATGMVCAVLGIMEEDGRFDVDEMIFYASGPQYPLSPRKMGKTIVLMSGINQSEAHEYCEALNIFQHWLAGNLDDAAKQVRLIIAGNSVRSTPTQRFAALQVRTEDSSNTVEAMRELDVLFAKWSYILPIDVMPGPTDPANFMLPQQPFHKCMFPMASEHDSFRSVSNPYSCSVDDVLLTGCSGQNVRDLLRCTFLESPLDALRSTLACGHIAPTAPDTLACYPYVDNDPFIMRECPHIYFAGNCDAFATDLHVGSDNQRTRLVCIPSFSKTQNVAVVNLDTLDCHQISFNKDNY